MYTCHSHACYSSTDFERIRDYFSYKVRDFFRIFIMKKYQKPILTISEETKKRLSRSGIQTSQIEVLANGIDTEYWKAGKGIPVLRNELGIHGDSLLVGTVARIAYDKDIPTFLEVVRETCKNYPNIRFVIVGDGYGDELENAKKQIKDRGLSDIIHLTGHRNDLIDVYKSLDIFLMTSLTEGMPNTLLEAMAMEIPIVSTNPGGIPELIEHGVNGLLSPVGDVMSLVNNLEKLITNPVLRKKFSKMSRRKVENHFSFSKRVCRLEKYYTQVMGSGN
jgi:glycosyltransferase involved in cell wall biosynthesis